MEKDKQIRINEIFYGIQGESTYAGERCVFIRTTGCNLRCAYCDTQYAFEEGSLRDIPSILEEVKKSQCSLVTVTGGEPLEAKGTIELLSVLRKNSYRVLLETNGTLPLNEIPEGVVVIMDIKCPSSGYGDKTCWDNLNILSPKDEIKFVLCDATDYQWAIRIVGKYRLNEKHTVLFSPASPQLEARALSQWILRDHAPVKLQPQLHKIIWGEGKRGI